MGPRASLGSTQEDMWQHAPRLKAEAAGEQEGLRGLVSGWVREGCILGDEGGDPENKVAGEAA